MKIQAEISLYPFGVEHLGQPVREFVAALKHEGFEVNTGSMSSTLTGDSTAFFSSLDKVFTRTAEKYPCVLVLKVSNVCPVE